MDTQPPNQDPKENPPQNGDKIVKGVVERVVFRSEGSGFGVLQVRPIEGTENRNAITMVGVVPLALSVGTTFDARGRWQTHPKFGEQFRAWSITEVDPSTEDGVYRYLSSGEIRGIGPVTAQKIVETFGVDSLAIIDKNPSKLLDVPGVGPKKYQEIAEAWVEKRPHRELLLFFHNHGIASGLAQRIIKRFGLRAIEVVRENPYVLCEEMWGIGFQTADRIALSLGIEAGSAQRLRGGLVFAMERASEDGHAFLPKEQLLGKTAKLLGLENPEILAPILEQAIAEGAVYVRGDNVYARELFEAEELLAAAIAKRIILGKESLAAVPLNLLQHLLQEGIISAPSADGTPRVLHLSDQQRQAVTLVRESPLVVITGGPGCGKTTIVRTVSRMLRESGHRIKLAAPTGRAAQRLSEVCQSEASTIHRLLRFDPTTREFQHREDDPLPIDALIVDESSMIDLPLAAALFRAIPPSARVIIVGDADQLPSVGPGLFLHDLLSLEEVPRVCLTNLFRRSQESLITTIAHQINAGDVPEIPQPDGITKTDAYFLPITSTEEGAVLVEKLVSEQIPKKFGISGQDITVLTPMNNGELGVISLNKRLQNKLVIADESSPRVFAGALEFRLGDRVCQRSNNYNIIAGGVFNGDQGEVIGIDAESQSVFVKLWDGREVEYTRENIHQLDLAYAISIHRSQGSEIPAVVLALHDSHMMLLERQLIYTGVTRAKKLLIVVGTKRAFILACKKSKSKRRYSGLVSRVREKLRIREQEEDSGSPGE